MLERHLGPGQRQVLRARGHNGPPAIHEEDRLAHHGARHRPTSRRRVRPADGAAADARLLATTARRPRPPTPPRHLHPGPDEAPGPCGGFIGGERAATEGEDRNEDQGDGARRHREAPPRAALGVGADEDVGADTGKHGQCEVQR